MLYSVSFLVQSKENSREKPGREINLKDTSDGANHAVTTGSNGSFNCLLSRPVLKQVTQTVQFLQEVFPKPLYTANPRQLTPPTKENVFSFRVTIDRYETVMQFPTSLFGNSSHGAMSSCKANCRAEDCTARNVLGSSPKQLTPRGSVTMPHFRSVYLYCSILLNLACSSF